MAKTLEVVKFRDVIRVSEITRFVPNLASPTIEIHGSDFSSVDSVSINEVPVPDFFIINRTTLWAQLPQGATSLRTISVLSSNFTKTAEGSLVSFELGTKSRAVSGILRLTQLFTKWLLQSTNSDVFNPGRGGGLQDLASRMISTHKTDPLLGSISRAVEKTANEIRSTQVQASRLPLSERLLAATLVDVNVSTDLMEARARIQIDSVAGDSAVSAFQL